MGRRGGTIYLAEGIELRVNMMNLNQVVCIIIIDVTFSDLVPFINNLV